ncbi:MAG: Mannose-6-phosphate isomerase [uncultured Pyrinomonadaceae bacterium]|uniref:Mannose-6-phosphate isomerase n=1 Tax=uncultured Pyrinomonadaceae bacterium TaxID=2283094 RepID=A0A6J4P7U8_9BACT|nr:MAG: Mannose-6-phosphate isomerase [uncultured Pyrinomonadaceae bacterium]
MKEKMKKSNFNEDIVKLAQKNDYFRRVLLTTELSQLVVMSIQPGEDIGEETHDGIDQILSIVSGAGAAMIEGVTSPVKAGSVVVVPAGTRHNFVNTGKEPLKLYTVYAPPDHKDDTVHRTKADALTDPNEQHEE